MVGLDETDLDGLLAFLAKQEEFVFLDTSRPDTENNKSYLFLNPVDRLVCRGGDDLEDYLEALQQRVTEGFYLAGWVGYEFGAMLEGGVVKNSSLFIDSTVPLADLGVFLKPLQFDHHTGENDFPFTRDWRLQESEYSIKGIRANMEKQEFVDALNVVRRYIGAGDTYQVNYTMKLLFDFHGSAERFYKVLRRNQSVAYGAYIRNGEERTLSFSPELFFRKKGGEITVRPMKGTARRGRNSQEEKSHAVFLHNDIKNRSENVMIVDLLRNDLARLVYGHGQSRVFVDSLFDVESYESLLQMTSTVKATTNAAAIKNLCLTELFRALFPCGSITGAPKIRTMQIIDELEKSRRGVYTGAIGYFGPDGSAVFNVPIRTVRLQGNVGEMGIGAGITYDSVPEEEWRESLLKGRFLTHSQPEFQLFETILWQQGQGYWLLEDHLQRLGTSAKFFKFYCDFGKVRKLLMEEERHFSDKFYRVRVVLAKDGRLSCASVQCAPPICMDLPQKPHSAAEHELPTVSFFNSPVDTKSPWCFHKTTMRGLYDSAYEQARAEGLYDAVFCNEAGEVTEGSITNIVIYAQGRYRTPPVSSGLLAGVMRGRLLANQMVPVVEEVMTARDVRTAEAVFLCNSVRGVIRVRVR